MNATAISYYKDAKCDKKAGHTIAVLPGMTVSIVSRDSHINANAFEKPPKPAAAGEAPTGGPVGKDHVVALFAPPKVDPAVAATRRLSLGARASDPPPPASGARTFYWELASKDEAENLVSILRANVASYMASPAARERIVDMASALFSAAGVDTGVVDVSAALDRLYCTKQAPPAPPLPPSAPERP